MKKKAMKKKTQKKKPVKEKPMKEKPLQENLICINCPMGCNLEVTYDSHRIIEVEGNTCKRGAAYAETEIFHPERVVTTTVRVLDGAIPFVPVKTEKTVPKELTFDVVKRAYQVCLKAPVKVGDVVVKNIVGTGINLIATRNLAREPLAPVKKTKKIRRKKRNA
ncbi:DUF1667 domain-containing protein [Candidatus Omnitrophota bacterium]